LSEVLTDPYRFVSLATTYPDSFGDTADGTVSGVVIDTSDPKVGSGCLEFDGSSTGVNVPVQLLPTGTADFTYSFWFQLATFDSQMELLRQDYEVLFQKATGDILITGEILVNKSNLTLDTWYLLQSVRSGGTETSYLNYDAYSLINSSPLSIGSSTNWFIGGRSSGAEGLNGKMDSIVFFNRALSDSERSDIYNSGSPSTIEDTFTTLASRDELKLWYSCDALTNSTLINDAIPVS